MKLIINVKAVRNGPTTGTEAKRETLPVNIDSRYPMTDAMVTNVQMIQSNT